MAFNNSSTTKTDHLTYTPSEKIAIVSANMLLFCLAIPANGIVITVISRVQNVRTPTSTFLLNLCIADILIASLYIPFVTVDLYVIDYWVFGDFMCRLVSFLFYLATNFSILILTAISVERYISVCLPRQKRLTAMIATVTTIALWFVAAIAALPMLIVRKSVPNRLFGENVEFCVETWSFKYAKVYRTLILAVFYVMPLVVMALVYYNIGRKVWASADKTRSMKLSTKHASNSKLRLTKIALAIIFSFTVSWTPWNIMTILFYFDRKNYPYSEHAAHVVSPMIYFVAFSNCALNPLLYCYMSQNFRKALQIFRKRHSRRDLGDSITASSRSSRSSFRRFSRRSKRNAEQAADELNDAPPEEKGTLRTNSENHDCSRTSQPSANHTRESILMMSAL